MIEKSDKINNEGVIKIEYVKDYDFLKNCKKVAKEVMKSKMSASYFEKEHKELESIHKTMGLDLKTCALLSVFLVRRKNRCVDIFEIFRAFQMDGIDAIEWEICAQNMCDIGILSKTDVYVFNNEFLRGLCTYSIMKGAKVDIKTLNDALVVWKSGIMVNREGVYGSFIKKCRNMPFFNRLNDKIGNDKLLYVLIGYISLYVLSSEREFYVKHANDFPVYWDENENFVNNFGLCSTTKNNFFIDKGILENITDEGIVDLNYAKFSESFERGICEECGIDYSPKRKKINNMQIIKYVKIDQKKLFFDGRLKENTDTLKKLLQENNFSKILQRMDDRSMKKSFTCLLYGAAGTGKTELCKQIAKYTHRDIYQVDMSNIRNMWVGESEKNTKQIFTNYRKLIKKAKKTPILLFNEADALFSKRTMDVKGSVDQMNNSMQNILLQEMEDFEGILIATTNLDSNMDSAFERRFLYKVKFEKPSKNVMSKIWKSNIPSIKKETTDRLVMKYNLSGGQISNIAKKACISEILYGNDTTSDEYEKYCKEEMKENNNKLGF